MQNKPTQKLDRGMLNQIASINLQELKTSLDELLRTDPSVRKVLLISPVGDDYRFIHQHFPQFDLYITEIHDWNLDERCQLRLGAFDLAIASNVMMYSRDPQLWIDHILEVSRYFAVQDLVYRKRSAKPPYLGDDMEAVRYCHSGRGVSTSFPTPFDLNNVQQPLRYFKTYAGGMNEFHEPGDTPVHFVAIISTPEGQTVSVPPASAGQQRRFKLRNLIFGSEALHKPYRALLKVGRWLRRS